MQDKILIIRGGEQTRDFIYVKDVANANFIAATNEIGGTFNIGSGKQTQINSIVKLVSSITNKKPRVKYISKKEFDCDFSQASISNAQKHLKWQPKTTLKKGIEQTIKYYSNLK